MPLRSRLTLLYTTLLGGILLFFGLTVYNVVSMLLIDQLDQTLIKTYSEIISNTEVDTVGNINVISLPALNLTADVYAQVWSRDGILRSSNISQFQRPLDATGLRSSVPVFRDVMIEQVHLRVFTIPLQVGEHLVGAMQLGSSLAVVDATQRALITVLVGGAVAAMVLAGLATWFSTKQALRPLQAVTETALQISRADDLSRRILYSGPPDDEIGSLINTFNQTLARLENLFNSQRRFLADVGHELRTPLTVIKGNVDLIRKFGKLDTESIDGIVSEVDRLTRLVGDLLLLAQAESGKLPLAQQVVELDTILLEVFQQMRVLYQDKLQMRIGEIDQVLVCGDKDRLKQVLVNLVSNAIQYTPAGGEVIVSVGKAGNQAKLTVSDTGPGIPPEDLQHVFERFYRGEKSRSRPRDGKGFGLGLSIAYWIVRNHGGRIEVDSQMGQGTSFCVWLPLTEGNCSPETAS